MVKNIMLAFVSPVSEFPLRKPINYPDIQGRPYTAIQTNESAIVYVSRMLEPQSLEKIFLIASDSVKNGKVQLENEFGDVTHLEFLRRRIAKEFPQLTERFSIQDYSEDGTGSTKLENNILQIAQIADAVKNFAKNSEEVVVHADMTGGFRHTSMLMLSIIQLLRYRGIRIGEVLYSDPASREVYRVTEIQRMFTLITGADEFVKFGSVEALNEYFGAEPPPAVKDLLEAMNRFAEAIKICRTSAIEDELENLSEHIKNFRKHPDRDLKSELFAKIIDTIEREYGKLIGGAASRLEIIRWCMRKGFWQQAMTLCTEWLPEEIINRRVCMPRDITVIESCTSKGRSAHKSWQQYFIIDYKIAEKVSDTRSVCEELRDTLRAGDANRLAELKKF
ncbi:MAG: TM1812 family CRISPR-associated protein, partial [Selenomonadaceae bacterium]|nr:TM1812 family CRISPR-associated protein [Selenomonadaceae bacterium]